MRIFQKVVAEDVYKYQKKEIIMEEKNFEGISHKCIRSGQKGPYQDSESVYKITVEEGELHIGDYFVFDLR